MIRALVTLVLLVVTPTASFADSHLATKRLVGGYVIDVPTVFEIRSYSYRQELDRDTRTMGGIDTNYPSELILVAGRWSGGFQFAFLGVRTYPEWDALYGEFDNLTVADWKRTHDQMLANLAAELANANASVIEMSDPLITSTPTGDKLVLLQHRRENPNTTITAGQWLFIRSNGSFGVTFSYDEQAGYAEYIQTALQSIRQQP